MAATKTVSLQIKKLTYSALFLALALVLPFLTGQIPEIGAMLCPMHIPALLCGFICGWPWGLAVGLISPILRSLIFSMPPMFPAAVSMAAELAVYGAVSGILYKILPRKAVSIYIALLTAMVAGRAAWGIVRFAIAGLQSTSFTFAAFFAGAVTSAIPGIILQIVLIPLLVLALKRTKIMLND